MKSKVYFTLFFVMLCAFGWAQSRQVSGRVTSQSNSEALAGVTITVKGTNSSATTNSDGHYTITVPNGNAVLVFSYVGHQSKEVKVNNQNTIDVQLNESTATMNDVVVIGYQTVRRRDLTGSVSSINAKQLRDIPINSAAQALAGKLAGVQVTGTEGSPGADVIIRVRGGGSITQDNAPLYIIDGVQVENGLNTISPQDIASIDVLKDASTTAIYGARGANGVVIITTKGGRRGKPRIDYNGFIGVNKLAKELDVMKPYDFVIYQYERSRGSAEDSTIFADTYGTTWDTLANYKNVPFADWQEKMFGRSALTQTHNISLNGGDQQTQYNLSLTSNSEQGLIPNSDFNRKLASFKFDHTFSNWLKLGFNTRYNNTVINGSGTSSSGSSSTNRLRHSVKYRPILLPGQTYYDYDPNYAAETNTASLQLVNPILLNQAEYRKNTTNVLNLSGYAQLNFNKYLSFKSTVGYDYWTSLQQAFDDTITGNSKLNGASQPLASVNTLYRKTINNSNVLTYTNSGASTPFSKNNDITVLIGHEVYETRSNENGVEVRYFPVGISPQRALNNLNLASAPAGVPQPKPTSSEATNRILSFFGRINYNLYQKYLLTLSMRSDGSSKFAEGHKWSYFPSGSLAWRISNESFFENLKSTINDLKLRVSYGKAGNNRIPDFLYLTQFNSNVQYGLNDALTTGFAPAALANPDLVWETTNSRNIGLDASFLRNRIQLTFDVYSNRTNDLLVAVPIPPTSGYTRQIQNVGSTSNKGFEIQLNGTPIQNKNFTWTANFNISHNSNKVLSLGDRQTFYLENSGWGLSNSPADYIVKVGYPVGSMWGLVTDGYYTLNDFDYNADTKTYTLKPGIPNNKSITSTEPQPGLLKFKDLNGDTVVDNNDRTVIGNANPKFFGGLNQQFTYKNFDMSVYINFQFGNDVYNANKLEFTNAYQPNANMLAIMNNRWRTIDANGNVVTDPAELAKINANATIWAPSTSSTSYTLHSWAIEDGSFVRINNVTLGYNLPASLIQRIKLERARFYVTVNNLAVFTNYSGYDPEVSTRRSTPVTPGVDYAAYPRSRSFIFGVNLSL